MSTTHVPETGTSFLVPVSGMYVMGISQSLKVAPFNIRCVRKSSKNNHTASFLHDCLSLTTAMFICSCNKIQSDIIVFVLLLNKQT